MTTQIYYSTEDFKSYFNTLHTNIIVLCDTNTRTFCLPHVQDILNITFTDIIEITPGESNKTIQTAINIWEQCIQLKANRNTILLNLGGGVITDIGAFCAATFMRGIPCIHVPTTVLAQCDAAYGGKCGVDLQHYKNYIGSFYNPNAIFIHPEFLNTLDERQINNGLTEVIKHIIIYHPESWETFATEWESRSFDWENWVRLSMRAKSHFVYQDPYDLGMRKALNFGHTIGHAIESSFLALGQEIYHGEAVAAGMIAELYLCEKICNFPTNETKKYLSILHQIGKNVQIEDKREHILRFITGDKKNSAFKTTASLLRSPAQLVINQEISLNDLEKALDYYEFSRTFV